MEFDLYGNTVAGVRMRGGWWWATAAALRANCGPTAQSTAGRKVAVVTWGPRPPRLYSLRGTTTGATSVERKPGKIVDPARGLPPCLSSVREPTAWEQCDRQRGAQGWE